MGFKGARSSLRVEHYINIDDLRTFALFQIDWISYTPENAHVHTAGEGYWSAVFLTPHCKHQTSLIYFNNASISLVYCSEAQIPRVSRSPEASPRRYLQYAICDMNPTCVMGK